MKKKKFIVLDIFEISEEEMKEKGLFHKIRFTTYWYDTKQVVEGGLPDDLKNLYYIGEVMYDEE